MLGQLFYMLSQDLTPFCSSGAWRFVLPAEPARHVTGGSRSDQAPNNRIKLALTPPLMFTH